jgi:hypothetical protein
MNNVGTTDRKVRITIALVLVILYFTNVIPTEYGDILLLISGILGFTAFRKCCPVYALLGFGTCGVNSGNKEPRIKTRRLDL